MEMNQFRWNTLSDKLFSTNIRFGVQAKGNSEMDYGKPLLLVRVQWNSPLKSPHYYSQFFRPGKTSTHFPERKPCY